MERDPVRFVWRAAPGRNVALLALYLVLAGPALLFALDLLRSLVDDVVSGLAFAGRGTARFARYVIDPPDRLWDGAWVIVPGLELSRPEFAIATLLGLGAAVAVLALSLGAGGLVAATIGRSAAARLSGRALDALAAAPARAGEEARAAAVLAERATARHPVAFGYAGIAPVLLPVAAVVLVAYVATIDLLGALGLAVGLALYAVAASWAERVGVRLAEAGSMVGIRVGRVLSGLARNLAALAAHGTAGFERQRVAADLEPVRRAVQSDLRRGAVADASRAALVLAVPCLAVGAGILPDPGQGPTPGGLLAAAAASLVAVAAVDAFVRWRQAIAATRPAFAEIARTFGSLQARRREGGLRPLPASGPLVASGLSATGQAGGRLLRLDLALDLPAHVALVGDPGSGVRTFAAVLGQQVVPSAGSITFAEVPLADAEPASRARRLAFAGGETYLFPGLLRANLVYGADGQVSDEELAVAVAAAGLDSAVDARGLAGPLDPRREPDLARTVVSARRAIRAALDGRGQHDFVEPFDPSRYNPHATIGENILFGVAVGDTFRESRLPGQPFVRSLLDAQGLAKPLGEIGAAIARQTLELFADLPEGSPLVGRFALLSADEREVYEQLLARRESKRRGAASARDSERLIGLSLRYCERRHRLGLLDTELEDRILAARAAFAETLPPSLRPAIAVFDPEEVCPAASLRDNLLFGRIAHDRADAERDVLAVVADTLDRTGLRPAVRRLGLETRLDPAETGFSRAETSAIDLVRCLVRRPDTLVVEHALEGLSPEDGAALVGRLEAAQADRGLLVVVPEAVEERLAGRLPVRVRFEAGSTRPPADAAPADIVPAARRGGAGT